MTQSFRFFRAKILISFVGLLGMLLSVAASALSKNGFELNGSLVPLDEILSGGPPKDGIASIDKPVFINSGESKLGSEQRVMGVYFEGVARAYPIGTK
jgi:hypothetical protein